MNINKIKDNGLIKYLLENGGILNVLEPEKPEEPIEDNPIEEPDKNIEKIEPDE
jgi:hypothetical protein